jgi:hypothetical protein
MPLTGAPVKSATMSDTPANVLLEETSPNGNIAAIVESNESQIILLPIPLAIQDTPEASRDISVMTRRLRWEMG